jgi:hypothetical protein
MPGFIVHVNAAMTCPHITGTVTVAPGAPRVTLGPSKMAVATKTSLLTVAGCLFQVPAPPGTKPQPCVTVTWANVSARVKANGVALLLQEPVTGPGNGTAKSIEPIPAGPPIVNFVQGRVHAM